MIEYQVLTFDTTSPIILAGFLSYPNCPATPAIALFTGPHQITAKQFTDFLVVDKTHGIVSHAKT